MGVRMIMATMVFMITMMIMSTFVFILVIVTVFVVVSIATMMIVSDLGVVSIATMMIVSVFVVMSIATMVIVSVFVVVSSIAIMMIVTFLGVMSTTSTMIVIVTMISTRHVHMMFHSQHHGQGNVDKDTNERNPTHELAVNTALVAIETSYRFYYKPNRYDCQTKHGKEGCQRLGSFETKRMLIRAGKGRQFRSNNGNSKACEVRKEMSSIRKHSQRSG